MTEQQVKDLVGVENWEKFNKWIRGQTVGINKDGSIDFYDHDVLAFKRSLTGYDRQSDPFAWD